MATTDTPCSFTTPVNQDKGIGYHISILLNAESTTTIYDPELVVTMTYEEGEPVFEIET